MQTGKRVSTFAAGRVDIPRRSNSPSRPAATFSSGRCVQCGRATELVVLAEGFQSIGWCRQCDRDNQQPTFDLSAVTP